MDIDDEEPDFSPKEDQGETFSDEDERIDFEEMKKLEKIKEELAKENEGESKTMSQKMEEEYTEIIKINDIKKEERVD